MGIDTVLFEEIASTKARLSLPQDAAALVIGDCKFHTEWGTGDNRRDLEEFGRRAGFGRVESIDLYGNPTVRADLHDDLRSDLVGRFDMVVDAGTLYCCFDVAQVWKNYLAALKPKGVIVHTAAMTGYIGRGYYNLHPALFRDFYVQNKFEFRLKWRIRKSFEQTGLLRRLAVRFRKPQGRPTEISANDIFVNDAAWYRLVMGSAPESEAPILPNDTDIICIAWRDREHPFVKPLPTYFREHSGG